MQSNLCKILVDSGASANFISKSFLSKCHSATVKESSCHKVKLPNGSFMHTSQSVYLTLYLGEQQQREQFVVLDIQGFDIILGIPWLKKHTPITDWSTGLLVFPNGDHVRPVQGSVANASDKLLTLSQMTAWKPDKNFACYFTELPDCYNDETFKSGSDQPKQSEQAKVFMDQLVKEFPEVFPNDLPNKLPPMREIQHEIKLKDPAADPPFRQCYKLGPKELKELQEQIEYLLEKGMIRPSSSPYGAPILFASKKDGGLRMCTDYRPLNENTIKDGTKPARSDQCVDALASAKYISKIDLRWGYWQIRMHTNSIEKTAFTTPFGHFEYLVVPFGLTNAPATFIKLMNSIFRHLINRTMVVYMDDILVYSTTLEQHKKDVRQVMQLLKDNQLYTKPSKCDLFKSEVEFLGNIVGNGHKRMCPEKIKAVMDWPTPTSSKAVQRFTGLCNFVRDFIKDFAKIAKPLYDIQSDEAKFTWGKSQQQAFHQLKQAVTSAPALILPDFDKPFVLQTDASGHAAGAVLLQDQGKGLQVICYASRRLPVTKAPFDAYNSEAMGLYFGLEKFRSYLIGSRCTIQTDHKALTNLIKQKSLTPKQLRMIAYMTQFDCFVEYIKGIDNTVSDALSRQYLHYLSMLQINATIQVQMPFMSDITAQQSICAMCQHAKGQRDDVVVRQGILHHRFTAPDGGYRYRVLIPKQLQLRVLEAFHLDTGHFGYDKLIEVLQRKVWWPTMKSDAKHFIINCPTCQRNKTNTQVPFGPLQEMPIPDENFQSLGMDFIQGLPETVHGYDTILAITDRRSKWVTTIATDTHCNALKSATMLHKYVTSIHGLPDNIITDRDSRFLSSVWKYLMEQQVVKTQYTSGCHPQTNGQAERTNRTIEQVLRCFCSAHPTAWVDYLPHATSCINNTVSKATGVSPYYAVYGKHPRSVTDRMVSTTANTQPAPTAATFQQIHAQVQAALVRTQEQMVRLTNKKRREVPIKVNDFVWLSRDVAHFNNPSWRNRFKLSSKYIGPYKVIEQINPVAFRLELPDHLTIHPVFHVSELRPHKTSVEVVPDDDLSVPGSNTVDTGQQGDDLSTDHDSHVAQPPTVKQSHRKSYPGNSSMPASVQKGKQPRLRGALAKTSSQVAPDEELEDAAEAGPSRVLGEDPVPSEDEPKSTEELDSNLDMPIGPTADAIKYDASAGLRARKREKYYAWKQKHKESYHKKHRNKNRDYKFNKKKSKRKDPSAQ